MKKGTNFSSEKTAETGFCQEFITW